MRKPRNWTEAHDLALAELGHGRNLVGPIGDGDAIQRRHEWADRVAARMSELGFGRAEPTEWTEAEKEADRRAEAEEMAWLGSGMQQRLHEAIDRMERDEAIDVAATRRAA